MIWLVLGLGTLFLGILLVRYMVSMPSRSHRGSLPPLSEPEAVVAIQLRRHVEMLAHAIGERHLYRPAALEAAADYISAELTAAGLPVVSQRFAVQGVEVRNLIATVDGADLRQEIVVIGAHYDSVPGCPAANDNGSGVAAMLELGRLWSGRPCRRTLRLVAFVNEEPPFCFTSAMGSRRYARACRRRNDDVVAMASLETIGWYSEAPGSQRYPPPFGLFYPKVGNFIGFVGNLRSRRLVQRCVGWFRRGVAFPSEGTAAPGYLPGIFWSDHWSFWREGYRALMVTDTAPFRYPYYHTAQDTADRVDYERTARVVTGLNRVIEGLVNETM